MAEAARRGRVALAAAVTPSPIEDYAVIGDGRTAALVNHQCRIDWLAAPTLDAPPILACIVDPENGGFFSLAPEGDFRTERRYLDGTNVLETTISCDGGTAVVTDAFTLGGFGVLPWVELVRRVEGRSGQVELDLSLVVGDRFGQASPFVRKAGDVVLIDLADQQLALRISSEGDLLAERGRVRGHLTVREGETVVCVLSASDREPLSLPAPPAVLDRLERTISTWRTASGRIDYAGKFQEEVERSALALWLLLQRGTGAIAAAATTSLPEQPGGSKNYDYRYCWIRDTSLAIDALISLGLHEEVQSAVSFLLSAVARTAPDLHVFYSLDGDIANETAELAAAGYRGSRPVRSGNSAAGQRQLGTFGDLFTLVDRYLAAGHVLDPATRSMLAAVAERCCDIWREKDAGFWELSQYEHYTISKMQCWAALDRAVSLANAGNLPSDRAERWATERDAIRAFVEERCFSKERNSYTFYADSDQLDAAVLLAGRLGFDEGERLDGSIEACRRELGAGPLLYRYSGMRAEEGSFVACAFWVVDALVRTGRKSEGLDLMAQLVTRTNDVGLFSEQQEPDGRFLGNIPQGLSHLALIHAALLLQDATTG